MVNVNVHLQSIWTVTVAYVKNAHPQLLDVIHVITTVHARHVIQRQALILFLKMVHANVYQTFLSLKMNVYNVKLYVNIATSV